MKFGVSAPTTLSRVGCVCAGSMSISIPGIVLYELTSSGCNPLIASCINFASVKPRYSTRHNDERHSSGQTTGASTPHRRDGEARERPGRNAPREHKPHRVKDSERRCVAVRHLHDRLMPYQQVDERGTDSKCDADAQDGSRHDQTQRKNGILLSTLTPVLVLSSHDPTIPRKRPPMMPLPKNSAGFSCEPQ